LVALAPELIGALRYFLYRGGLVNCAISSASRAKNRGKAKAYNKTTDDVKMFRFQEFKHPFWSLGRLNAL
jgi:hypothetical protein